MFLKLLKTTLIYQYHVAITKEVLPKLPKFKNDLNLSEKELLVKLSNSGLEKRLKENNIKRK